MFNYILQGQVKKYINRLKNTNMFNLEDWLKSVLNLFNVPYYDDCCPTNNVPVRYSSNDTLEKYNGSQWEQIDVCALSPSTNRHYGSFYSMQNQSGGSIKAFTFDNTDFTNGVTIQNNSEISFTQLGKYNIAFSAQIIKTGGTTTEIYIWLRHQGVDVPNTATVIEMRNNNVYNVAAWNFFIDVNTNPQQFELMWYTSSTHVSIGAINDVDTPAGVPAVPSIILTVNQID
jgi:hypothetical protein